MAEFETIGYYRWPSIKYSSVRNNKRKSTFRWNKILILLIGFFLIPVTLLMSLLYFKYTVFVDHYFWITNWNIFEVTEGVSSTFCEMHSLNMDKNFNVFHVENSVKRKMKNCNHRLTLEGDYEYLNIYPTESSRMNLSLCSTQKGTYILAVKDGTDLNNCGFVEYPYTETDKMLMVQIAKKRHIQHKLMENRIMRGRLSNNRSQMLCLKENVLVDTLINTSIHCGLESKMKVSTTVRICPENINHGNYFYMVLNTSPKFSAANRIHIDIESIDNTYDLQGYKMICSNVTNCFVPIALFSNKKVIVEPIWNDINNISILHSSCQPRRLIYVIFTGAILFTMLLAAFV